MRGSEVPGSGSGSRFRFAGLSVPVQMNKTVRTKPTATSVPTFRSAYGPRSVIDKLRRLRSMPFSEIAGRSRQEAAKLIDRVTTVDRPVDPATILRDQAPAFVNPAAALEILRQVAPSRFFAGVENLQFVSQAVAGHRDAVMSRAAATLQHRFDLLGYQHVVVRGSDRLASRSGVVAPRAARPLDAVEPARPCGSGRQQSRVGAESAPVGRRPGTGVCA